MFDHREDMSSRVHRTLLSQKSRSLSVGVRFFLQTCPPSNQSNVRIHFDYMLIPAMLRFSRREVAKARRAARNDASDLDPPSDQRDLLHVCLRTGFSPELELVEGTLVSGGGLRRVELL